MKALRTTVYTNLSGAFVSHVVREEDLQGSLMECMEGSRVLARRQSALVIFDFFDVPDGTSPEEAALIGVQRQSEVSEDETNMAILYHWDAQALRQTKDAGVVFSTRNAPLTVDQIKFVFEQLKEHPAYRKQTVTTTSYDGKKVSIRAGQVTGE
jgi:hypothetical protein